MIKHAFFFFVVILLFLISPSGVSAQTATLSLDPATGTFNKGCNFSLNVKIDTGATQTDGADAILFYDSSRLNTISITNGTIYPDYPGNNIDPTGKVAILSLASITAPFSGKGVLATVNFKVNDNATTGATQITFDFDPNNKAKTIDSNVVEKNTIVDVLNSVVNGNYTIGTGVCGVVSSPSPLPSARPVGGTPSATIAPLPTKQPVLPPAGSEQFTFAVAIFGGVLTVLGILGLALL